MAKASNGSVEEKRNSIFATRLRLLFDEKPNATQAQLSEMIGVTRQTVSQYVNGISEPGYAALVKIAEYFDVSIDYLLGRTDTRTTELSIKEVCKITGLNEHSLEILKSINAYALDYKCSEIKQLFGRNPEYAICLVNEFIDFALSPKDNHPIPFDHYSSFRKAAEQSRKCHTEWSQLSTEKQKEIIASLSDAYAKLYGPGQPVFVPVKTAAHFMRNIFCDEFNNYLASKHPT